MITSSVKKQASKHSQLIPLLLHETTHFKRGDKFFSERELVKKFNVGRNTAVEALKILESHGIVKRIQGKGTFFSGKTGIHDKMKTSTGNITLVLTDFEQQHLSGISFIRTIEREIRNLNYSLLVTVLDKSGQHAQIEDLLQMNKTDGYILWSVPACIQTCFIDNQIPAVVIGQTLFRELLSLAPDRFNLIYEATTHLLNLGHYSIGMISRDRTNIGVLMGIKGYEAAYRAAELSMPEDLIELDVFSAEDTRKKTGNLLDAKATALIFDGLDIYDTAKQEIAKRKLRIPKDLSVLITEIPNDLSLKDQELTGFKFDYTHMCKMAVKMIMKLINGKNIKDRILPFYFQPGKSCAKRKE